MEIFYKLAKALVILVIIVVALRFFIMRIIFQPSGHIAWTPDMGGFDYENVYFAASDSVKINGWYVNCENSRGTVLFFHGNAGNISHRGDTIRIFNSLGMSVFIIDYRGYGESKGSPSINGVGQDALAAWNWLVSEKRIPAQKILIFGRSLGGAVAVELMKHVRPKAAILESTFSALSDMAGFDFLSPIVSLLVGGAWNSAQTAVNIDTPTLCIHSPEDNVVPYRLGKRLYEALAGEKQFFEIRGDHNYGFILSMPEYKGRLDEFLTVHYGERFFDEVVK
ncbi:MAG: alpha/beta hydrolase [Synergistaceae bacterium]|nr:alpha/beta hydrolase [Synergistaceae bacterium]